MNGPLSNAREKVDPWEGGEWLHIDTQASDSDWSFFVTIELFNVFKFFKTPEYSSYYVTELIDPHRPGEAYAQHRGEGIPDAPVVYEGERREEKSTKEKVGHHFERHWPKYAVAVGLGILGHWAYREVQGQDDKEEGEGIRIIFNTTSDDNNIVVVVGDGNTSNDTGTHTTTETETITEVP